MSSVEETLSYLRRSDLGIGAAIETPYGRRWIHYADFTASGRFMRFVEDWLFQVRPYYANSHTHVSASGKLMTDLREQARSVVRRAVNAADDDVAMFVGSGATAAVNKLVGLLWLDIPNPAYYPIRPEELPRSSRPLVLVGPYEHHSNQLPWLESVAEVIEIDEAPDGQVDLDDLHRKLETAGPRPLVVGSFAAASNVTGVLTDVHAIARVLHKHGALAVFDYAASGPYAPIDMHPADDPDGALDAIFLSTHKFAGGPQSSGILVAHKRCFRRPTPERPGGGTVDYVAYFGRHAVDYTARLDEREEGGTPAILGDIRAGLAFLVKDMVGATALLAHECEMADVALKRLAKHPRIRLLGPRSVARLPILSFVVEGLHHDFVSLLLEHLFGIQTRSGCGCAGPYGHRLLDVSPAQSDRFRNWIKAGVIGVKPGWVRLTLSPYSSLQDVDFVLRAAEFVAEHGQLFLQEYALDFSTGAWRHRSNPVVPIEFQMTVDGLRSAPPAQRTAEPPDDAAIETERDRYFVAANEVVARLKQTAERSPMRFNPTLGDPALDAMVHFRFVHGCCSHPFVRPAE